MFVYPRLIRCLHHSELRSFSFIRRKTKHFDAPTSVAITCLFIERNTCIYPYAYLYAPQSYRKRHHSVKTARRGIKKEQRRYVTLHVGVFNCRVSLHKFRQKKKVVVALNRLPFTLHANSRISQYTSGTSLYKSPPTQQSFYFLLSFRWFRAHIGCLFLDFQKSDCHTAIIASV